MQYFLKAAQFLQEQLISWLSFFVLTFFIEFGTLGLLSFHVLRESKRAFLAQSPPDISAVWSEVPWEEDIVAWLWISGIRWGGRLVCLILLWPIYLTCGGLWAAIPLLGFCAYIFLGFLIVVLFSIESLYTQWFQLLYVDGYFTPKQALKSNWMYVRKMSRPIFIFCLIENFLHIPLFFSCVIPAVISRPVILIAQLIFYEEEREHILAISDQHEIQRRSS
jgi:hypothetical protein